MSHQFFESLGLGGCLRGCKSHVRKNDSVKLFLWYGLIVLNTARWFKVLNTARRQQSNMWRQEFPEMGDKVPDRVGAKLRESI